MKTNKSQTKNLPRKLQKLLRYTGDYISQHAALTLCSKSEQLPEEIAIISSHRRRPKQFGSHRIVFIYHPLNRPRHTTSVVVDGVSLTTATTEMALIDLVTDFKHSTAIENTAMLFSQQTWSAPKLLSLAQEISDSALKRCLFWAIWACEISYDHLLRYRLPRTTIFLDSRRADEPHGSDSKIHIQFPLKTLMLAPAFEGYCEACGSGDWVELRRYPPFRKFCTRHKWLPIYNDQRPKHKKLLVEFYAGELARWPHANRATLLASIVNGKQHPLLTRKIPLLCLNWAKNATNLTRLVPWLQDWITVNLTSNLPGNINCAIFFAFHHSKQIKAAISAIEKFGEILIKADEFQVIDHIISMLISSHKRLPCKLYIIAAEIHSRLRNFAKAHEILNIAENRLEKSEKNGPYFAEICFNRANLHTWSRDYDLALKEIHRGETILQKQESSILRALCMNSRGNIYSFQNNLPIARKNYLNSLIAARKTNSLVFQENVLFNLGIIACRMGRYNESQSWFAKSADICRQLRLDLRFTQSLFVQAVSLANIGRAPAAIIILKQVVDIFRHEHSHQNCIFPQAMALLAWCHDLTGHRYIANHYWARFDNLCFTTPDKGGFFVKSLQIMSAILRGQFAAAEKLIDKMLLNKNQLPAVTDEDWAIIHFFKNLSRSLCHEFKLDKDIKIAREILAKYPDRYNARLLNLYLTSHNVVEVTESEIDLLTRNNFHYPFWFYSAHKLASLNSPAANRFLLSQLEKSTANYLQHACHQFPEFKKFLNSSNILKGS